MRRERLKASEPLDRWWGWCLTVVSELLPHSAKTQVLDLKIELESKELNWVRDKNKGDTDQNLGNHSITDTVFPSLWSPFRFGV